MSDFLAEYARELSVICAALACGWLYVRTDAMRPLVLVFAPVVILVFAKADLTAIHTVAAHVQTVMFQGLGQK